MLGFILCGLFTLSSGVDEIITIICDFYPFWSKKLASFSKTNVMITIFAKTSFVLRQKRHFFANFFGENILKIITSVPGQTLTLTCIF
jgi:hypothetical protein